MLCFDHVSFAYPGERTILNDLSFSFPRVSRSV